MDIHYNAFISYRHHPEDIRAATQIHRALERFRVPKALRGKVELPLRLFRDKDELPITSNLSDDIFSALRNSEFLIVICSVHTKESLWVQREIETFLQTHDRSRVLTVLVSGEPYEVIPEILLYEEVTDSQTGAVTRIPMEPLSCDWRMGYRRACREELPRLAAALLHCGYDELRQRQRQYRMRQLIAVFSVALAASLALSAYFLYTTITIRNANIQIQENLEEALRNQSQFLVTAAREKLEKGDRLTAISLLLEALPSEENPRPYVADAEFVLSDALGVYEDQLELVARGIMAPTGSAIVEDFLVTEGEETLYLQDNRSIVTAWDAETMENVSSIDPHGTIEEMVGTTSEGGILMRILTTNELRCYSREGSLIWQTDNVISVRMSENGIWVYVLRSKDSESRELAIYHADTGMIRDQPISIPAAADGNLPHSFVIDEIPVDMPIPINYAGTYDWISLLDPVTGGQIPLWETENYLRTSCITEDGYYIFMVGDGSGMNNGVFGTMNTASPMGSDILCFDKTGKQLWQSKISTCTYTSFFSIKPVPDTPWVFCQAGDTVQLIRREDGAVVQTCNATDAVIGILQVTDEWVVGFLRDGCLFDYVYATNECTALDYNMDGQLQLGEVGLDYYTLEEDSTHITAFWFEKLKGNWEIALEGNLISLDEFRARGSKLALRINQEIGMVDMQSQSLCWKIPRETKNLLDYSADGAFLWASDYRNLVSIDTSNGETVSYPMPTQYGEAFLSYVTDPMQVGDNFYFLASTARNLLLYRFEPLSGTVETWEILSLELPPVSPELEPYAYYSFMLESFLESNPQDDRLLREAKELLQSYLDLADTVQNARIAAIRGDYAWIMLTDGRLFQVDMTTGDAEVMLTGLTELPPMAFREADGAIAVAVESEILLYLPGETEPIRRDLETEKGGSLCFHGEELLAVCDSGYLLRFDGDLQQLSRVELTVTYSFSTDLFSKYADIRSITWDFTPDNRLYLNLFNAMNVIDCECWGNIAVVPHCLMYDPASGAFLCSSVYNDTLRAITHYNTEELMAIAREKLGSFELSENQKQAYGLES